MVRSNVKRGLKETFCDGRSQLKENSRSADTPHIKIIFVLKETEKLSSHTDFSSFLTESSNTLAPLRVALFSVCDGGGQPGVRSSSIMWRLELPGVMVPLCLQLESLGA